MSKEKAKEFEYEVWVPVIGYENRYEVSSLGNIRTINGTRKFGNHPESMVLKPRLKANGYLQVNLYSDTGKMKSRNIHRVVLESFTGKKDGMTVNHKNEIKTDNRLENLEWMTIGENISYSTARPVLCIDAKSYEFVKLYPSISSVRKDGHDMRAVCHCCNKDKGYDTHHGFIWRYLDVEE